MATDKKIKLNLKSLTKLITDNKCLYEKCFILKAVFLLLHGNDKNSILKMVYDYYGRENIEEPETMGKNLLLITVKKPENLDAIVASVHTFTYDDYRCEVVPVKPFSAEVHMKVIGIPRLLIEENMSDFLHAVSEVHPTISDLNTILQEGSECSVVLVGKVTDLVAAKSTLTKGSTRSPRVCSFNLNFCNITGKMEYWRAAPLKTVVQAKGMVRNSIMEGPW